MRRTPEPELMVGDAQTRAYASADFEEPHARCLALLRARLADLAASGHALDLGCGPGDITIRFARAFPGWSVDALDGSAPMLKLARAAAARAGLRPRPRFRMGVIPRDPPPRRAYDLVFSNSLLHHLCDPGALWSTVTHFCKPGGAVFVMDLLRPRSAAAARALVARYAAGEPEVLRSDFYHSLLAAYRPSEIRRQLADASLRRLAPEIVSDRHLIVAGRI